MYRFLLSLVSMVLMVSTAVSAEDAKRSNALQSNRVGDTVQLEFVSEGFLKETKSMRSELVWRVDLDMPGASYIAPHFSRFNLPAGAEVIVRAPDKSRSWSYTGFGKSDKLIEEGFWGIHIPGSIAVVELWSRVPVAEGAVVIDSYAHGFPELDRDPFDFEKGSFLESANKAICGSDNSGWAKCYQNTEPTLYSKSRAVARLLIDGQYACTGWLVGSEGHLMTNEHCIGSASSALNTDYEFMAEGAGCSTNCASWGACPGTVVATQATLIQLDATLDYALVKLPTNPTGSYGYLRMRSSGATVNERIYIPQHPAHWGKKIGVTSDHSSDQSGFCEVYSKTRPPCTGGSGNDVGYYCDTQGGSSGSPVLGYSDHLVVALHHCANCPNRGVPIESVVSDLGSNLPANALGVAPPPPVSVTVAGPDTRSPNQAGTWSCAASGGVPPYTRIWFKTAQDGITDLGSSYYQTTSHGQTFNIVCDVLDSQGSLGTDYVRVSIGDGDTGWPPLPF